MIVARWRECVKVRMHHDGALHSGPTLNDQHVIHSDMPLLKQNVLCVQSASLKGIPDGPHPLQGAR